MGLDNDKETMKFDRYIIHEQNLAFCKLGRTKFKPIMLQMR